MAFRLPYGHISAMRDITPAAQGTICALHAPAHGQRLQGDLPAREPDHISELFLLAFVSATDTREPPTSDGLHTLMLDYRKIIHFSNAQNQIKAKNIPNETTCRVCFVLPRFGLSASADIPRPD